MTLARWAREEEIGTLRAVQGAVYELRRIGKTHSGTASPKLVVNRTGNAPVDDTIRPEIPPVDLQSRRVGVDRASNPQFATVRARGKRRPEREAANAAEQIDRA
jgi:hypothetical protein